MALAASDVSVVRVEVALDKARLWTRLGIRGSKVRRTLDWFRLVDETAAQARRLIEPRGAFRLLRVTEVSPTSVRCEGGVVLDGLSQARLLRGAEQVALGAATLGAALEDFANRLAVGGDHAAASLLSLVGDCALQEAQERVVERAREALEADGLRRGAVLQPGAQYWGLEANTTFARLLPLEAIGIRLLDTHALAPSKSKTFACAFAREALPRARS